MLAQGQWGEAYTTCSSILTQLGETVPEPESVSFETAESLVQNTLKRYTEVYGDDWLAKTMIDTEALTFLPYRSMSMPDRGNILAPQK